MLKSVLSSHALNVAWLSSRMRHPAPLSCRIFVIFALLAVMMSPDYAYKIPDSSADSSFAVDHVVFNNAGLSLYTTGSLARYVHPQDSFMLVSGNNVGDINASVLNARAAELRARFPNVQLYAATSGIDNVRLGAPELDSSLFDGLMMIYEPNQTNAPEFTWNRAATEAIWNEVAQIIRANGLQAWGKPSGRALVGRDKVGAWDYGELGLIVDGMNVQTQAACKKGEAQATVDDLTSQYRSAGAASEIFFHVTIASNQVNGVSASHGFNCAQIAWAKSEISRVTLWMATNLPNEAEEFLQLREQLMQPAQLPPPAPPPLPANTNPSASPDYYVVIEDSQTGVVAPGVLENDNDADGDSLTASLLVKPANGVLLLNSDGSFSYAPHANFNGVDSFTYLISDGRGGTGSASAVLTVNSINDEPVLANNEYETDEDVELVIGSPGVLGNDFDVDDDSLTASVLTGPSNGILTLSPDGSFSYTPDANFSGVDSFAYQASDTNGGVDSASVTINVGAVNDDPVTPDNEYSTPQDSELAIPAPGILGNDFDVDGDSLSASLVTSPSYGALSLNPDGSFIYMPNAGFSGIDTFVYQVSDDAGASSSATVRLTVEAIETEPLIAEPPNLIEAEADAIGEASASPPVENPSGGSNTVGDPTSSETEDSATDSEPLEPTPQASVGTDQLYVWDIFFESQARGKATGGTYDIRIHVDIRWDSDRDGIAEDSDETATNAMLILSLRNASGTIAMSFPRAASEQGRFTTNLIKDLPEGIYVAEVANLHADGLTWSRNLDPSANDTDINHNGYPDQWQGVP